MLCNVQTCIQSESVLSNTGITQQFSVNHTFFKLYMSENLSFFIYEWTKEKYWSRRNHGKIKAWCSHRAEYDTIWAWHIPKSCRAVIRKVASSKPRPRTEWGQNVFLPQASSSIPQDLRFTRPLRRHCSPPPWDEWSILGIESRWFNERSRRSYARSILLRVCPRRLRVWRSAPQNLRRVRYSGNTTASKLNM